jgi:hypothetical protein
LLLLSKAQNNKNVTILGSVWKAITNSTSTNKEIRKRDVSIVEKLLKE